MAVERAGTPHLIEVLDRVLDKGIVIDAPTRLTLGEIVLSGNRRELPADSLQHPSTTPDTNGGSSGSSGASESVGASLSSPRAPNPKEGKPID